MKISIIDQYPGFKSTVFYKLLELESKTPLVMVNPKAADIIIYGPFGRKIKTLGPFVKRRGRTGPIELKNRKYGPLHIFHTIENVRYNDQYDYLIGFDFPLNPDKEFRFPYWMESIDWTHEGVPREKPLRLSRHFDISELMSPLGNGFTKRNQRCAAFFGQMREPRKLLTDILSRKLIIDGYGRGFDPSIRNSQKSGIDKDKVLSEYSYNLCPENSLYPGYYTEKILESFACGCLPITWTDPNVAYDFNTEAFINLLPYASEGYVGALEQLSDLSALEKFAHAALLTSRPSIEPLRDFVRIILADAG